MGKVNLLRGTKFKTVDEVNFRLGEEIRKVISQILLNQNVYLEKLGAL